MTTHEDQPPGQGIDWIDRSACAYLILPVFLFCAWFVTPVAVALLALSVFGTWYTLRNGRSPSRQRLSVGLLCAISIVALGWTAISGGGHFFYANADWVMRDGVLHDLATGNWPPIYETPDSRTLILRAPIGYFLPAAAIGQVAGAGMADIALYAWTAIGLGLVLAAACSLFESRAQRIACVVVILMFGGMDLLGLILFQGHLPPMGEHIEWWMPYFQYSSNTTLLFWAPNHALPAWLGILLVLRHWRSPELARITPLLATAVPLWSPLAAIGLFPFFLLGLAWRRDLRTLFSPRTCLVFIPVAGVLAAYLGMESASVKHGWMLTRFSSPIDFAYCYALFCLLEFGILALVLARIAPLDLPVRIAIVVLCLLPMVLYGPGNDLAMRGSIPALTVLALATVRPLVQSQRSAWHIMLTLILAIGMLGAFQEPFRAMTRKAWQIKGQTLPEAVAWIAPDSPDFFPAHYFAPVNSSGVQRFMRKPVQAAQPEQGR